MQANVKWINYLTMAILLPFVYGCQAGGGLLGGLFGGEVIGGGGISGITGNSAITGATIAALHNPEPATMLLMGGGVMAMAFYKSRKK